MNSVSAVPLSVKGGSEVCFRCRGSGHFQHPATVS
jgi:hypothetical protein